MAAVEFEHDIPGRLRSDVLHLVRLPPGIEDHAVAANMLSERFQRALEDHDADVMRVDVRRIAGTGRERADVRVQLAQERRLTVEKPTLLHPVR